MGVGALAVRHLEPGASPHCARLRPPAHPVWPVTRGPWPVTRAPQCRVKIGHFFITKVKNLAPHGCPMGAGALPGSPLGLQQPYLQIMLPDRSSENAPGTVKMRLFAMLAHSDRKTHKSYARKALLQGAPTPKNRPTVPSLCICLPLLETQRGKNGCTFCPSWTPRPDHGPLDPGPGQPSAGPQGQPRAKTQVQGCVWAILRSGHHPKWGLAASYVRCRKPAKIAQFRIFCPFLEAKGKPTTAGSP